MRLAIAEDSVLLREGLVSLLQRAGIDVVAAVGDATALLVAVAEHLPDIALLDVRMPPSFTDEGIRAALEVRRRHPGVAVMVLSQYVEERYAGELMTLGRGGVGYLLKDRIADVAEFLDALRRVSGGGTVLDPEVVAQLLVRRRPDPLEQLTPRETEAMGLMAEGRSNSAMAAALSVSESAVAKYINSIFTKLGLPPTDNDHRRVLAVLKYLKS